MTKNAKLSARNGFFFITFTCSDWLPLFEETVGYDLVYRWLEILRLHRHQIIAYVIMPNHVHIIIRFNHSHKEVYYWISNGKRFLAYDIVKRLESARQTKVLSRLSQLVSPSDRRRGKKHQVFKNSFDVKQILTVEFMLQKIQYIHLNAIKKHWKLALSPESYLHSSARFYKSLNFKDSGIIPFWEVSSFNLVSNKTLR